MKKVLILFCFILCINCDYGRLKVIADLPKTLYEVSGMEYNNDSDSFWMINDGGNANKMYEVSSKGKILEDLKIDAKNHDWEDLTKDDKGTIYIADFGNNSNKRKDLVILIIEKDELSEKKAEEKKIKFSYPNQQDFPPKKSNYFFDAESVFYFNKQLYIFTKSRVKNNFGKTSLYKIPAKEGEYVAEFVASFDSCASQDCVITSAAISPNKKKVVLLSHKSILVFTDFKNDNFFSGKSTIIDLGFATQKESICFKDNNTVFISDERASGKGGNLYELKLY